MDNYTPISLDSNTVLSGGNEILKPKKDRFLIKENYLSEFSTEEDRRLVRLNIKAVEEADKDGTKYCRQNGQWVEIKTDLSQFATKSDLELKLNSSDYEEDKLNFATKNDLKYSSLISNKDLLMPNSVGGINKGTKVSDLETKNINYLFDDLLFPTILPSYGNPSILPSLASSIREIGSTAPNVSDFNRTQFDRAEIKINGASQQPKLYRAGEMTRMDITYNGSSELPSLMNLGNMTYNITIQYSNGDTPKDNKGNITAEALPSGSISKSINANGTFPVFAYINNSESLLKLPLKAWGDSMVFLFTSIPYVTGTVLMKTPKPIKVLKMLNTNSGKFEVIKTLPNISGDAIEWDNVNWNILKKQLNINQNMRDYYFYTIKDTLSSNKFELTI